MERYFVAETKGVNEDQLDVGVKGVEKAKIECAKKHFAKIKVIPKKDYPVLMPCEF